MCTVDKNGNITIPDDIRKILCLDEGDGVLFRIKKGKVIIKKDKRSCFYCGARTNLIWVKNISLCTKCIELMAKSAPGSVFV